MPRTAVNPAQVGFAGRDVAPAAPPGAGANNGITVPMGTLLDIINTSAAAITVTLDVRAQVLGIDPPDPVQTVVATTGRRQIYLNRAELADPDTNRVGVDFSAAAGVTYVASQVG